MDRVTVEAFKALSHHWIADVEVRDEAVELRIPDSEGWRLRVSATGDSEGTPRLVARWEPGFRPRPGLDVRRRIRRLRPRARRRAGRAGARPARR